jgi:hypothetical protein
VPDGASIHKRVVALEARQVENVLSVAGIRQHTSAYVSIRQHTSAYVSIRVVALEARQIENALSVACIRQHTSAYGSIRQHTSAYVSIRQHTSANELSPSRPGELKKSSLLKDAVVVPDASGNVSV